jgi:RNA polymerase sigma factor (TIGR02999 family)
MNVEVLMEKRPGVAMAPPADGFESKDGAASLPGPGRDVAAPAGTEHGPPTAITGLLAGWSAGDAGALDRLVPLVYADLRRIARGHLRRERDDHTLQSTALVHEAFVRLAQQRGVVCRSRGEFFGWMSMLMRRILVDHARGRNAAKRGEGEVLVRLDELHTGSVQLAEDDSSRWLDILHLDQALQRLAELDERQGRVVELRFFGGLSVEQTADALQVSVTTVKREWATARAWLLRELGRRTERAA